MTQTHTDETSTPPQGETVRRLSEVQAKQATDRPKSMLAVLIISTIGALLVMWLLWTALFA